MNLASKAFLIVALLQPLSAVRADSELAHLKAENARLKSELQTLRQACPAAAVTLPPPATPLAAAPAAAPAAAIAPAAAAAAAPASGLNLAMPAVAAPPPLPPVSLQAPLPVPAAPPPSSTAEQVSASTPVPAGYKLVPVNTPDYHDPLAPPYDRAGCSQDLFKGPPPAQWTDGDNWTNLRRGLSPGDVEALIGREHFNVTTSAGVEWQYGKCGKAVSGRVEFEDGKVSSWQTPDL